MRISDWSSDVCSSDLLPEAEAGTSGTANTSQTSNDRVEETINYEISKTVRQRTRESGEVQRLSVAVLVDGTYTANADGEPVYVPRTPEQIAKIETLVKSAIGFQADRGDTVEDRKSTRLNSRH